jgi:hypothetical protein
MKNMSLKLVGIIVLIIVSVLTFTSCSANKPSPEIILPEPADLSSEISQIPATQIIPPISRYSERITKKPFGIKISPEESPVQPEKFSGYHTGTDFEIFSDELNADVEISAICDGKIIIKRFATGYGGILVQTCTINNSDMTVVYGHLKLTSIKAAINDTLNKGDEIGLLGDAYSTETDGERKHLHLGIHKGKEINILGYVQTQKELDGWIDFEDII